MQLETNILTLIQEQKRDKTSYQNQCRKTHLERVKGTLKTEILPIQMKNKMDIMKKMNKNTLNKKEIGKNNYCSRKTMKMNEKIDFSKNLEILIFVKN